MYYLPPKWLAYTCLNFTVCDFVGRTHNCTKSNTARLLWALTLSFITPLKTGHNQQRYHEKELVESLVRNTEGFLLFGHNPDPVFSLSREAAMYSFALAPRKSIKPSWSSWERWSLSKSPSSRERGCPILPLLQQNSGLCRVVIPPHPACGDALSSGWLREEGLFSQLLSVHLVFLVLLFLLPAFPEAGSRTAVDETETHWPAVQSLTALCSVLTCPTSSVRLL